MSAGVCQRCRQPSDVSMWRGLLVCAPCARRMQALIARATLALRAGFIRPSAQGNLDPRAAASPGAAAQPVTDPSTVLTAEIRALREVN